jgi:5'-deoxynucleotidase YfbR-like HD superfamily hydrolase
MLREAGNVRRCHTLPHHGEYTVGKHSYDAAMLLLVLYPNASKNLLKAVLIHDLAERWTGDTPAPMKWAAEDFHKELIRVEDACIKTLGFDCFPHLTSEEEMWVDIVDKVELYCWCQDQMALGNRNADPVQKNLLEYFAEKDWPQEVYYFISRYRWVRSPDQLPQEPRGFESGAESKPNGYAGGIH